MKQTLALVLAGGQGSRLGPLSSQRAKPAVPFGSIYRLIDFSLSNALHSDVRWMGILTQYRPASLMDHIGLGHTWNFIEPFRQMKILPPQYGRHDHDWYQGTADAIYQNLNFINRVDVDLVLILSGDHIYKCDYKDLIDYHRKVGADLTISGIEIPRRLVSQFGIISTDPRQRIIEFQEKPKESKSNMASMGVYVFRRDVLERVLTEAQIEKKYDFGKDIIPRMITTHRVFLYPFTGYWRDVGTINSYWESNMDIIRDLVDFSLPKWQVITNHRFTEFGVRKPSLFRPDARIVNSVIANGCLIEGEVVSSILSPGVIVERGAQVHHSVIFHDCRIKADAVVHCAIIDKECVIGAKSSIGSALIGDWDPDRSQPPRLTVIAKGMNVSDNVNIAAGTQLDGHRTWPNV
ncbi:glucose-1-phosphate adenylyltransferase [bacterium]|nr:glucose-1-phosphate adenylyltransferase [bacterium]